MNFWLIGLLLIWFPVQDLMVAWCYQLTGSQGVSYFRFMRDALTIGIATVGFIKYRWPETLRRPAALYLLLLVAHIPLGFMGGIGLGAIISTAGLLLLPFLLFSVGYTTIHSPAEFSAACRILVGIGALSAAFGIWDISHTGFWTHTVKLGEYLKDIKGVTLGYEPESFLPWNFYGYGGVRRSGGLLAAPLAQGAFLALCSSLSLITFPRAKWVLVPLMLLGVLQSGTRGALLIFLCGALFYLLHPSNRGEGLGGKLLMVFGLFAGLGSAIYSILYYSVNLLDGSTIGHLFAFQTNIEQLPTVLIKGFGVGSAGAIVAQMGKEIRGGGEGSLFTMAFQMGVPTAIAFLVWYFRIGTVLRRNSSVVPMIRAHSLLFRGLLLGVGTTLVSSEHILTYSGMGAFWILVGGLVRVSIEPGFPDTAGRLGIKP